MTPEVSALSTINFRELAGGAGAVGHEMIEFVEAVTLKNGKLVSIWRWCGRCPCCYDFEVPEIEPAMPNDFSSRPPVVRDEITLELQPPTVDEVTGLLHTAEESPGALVKIITLADTITRTEELKFRFRAADPPEHENYLGVWRPPAWPADSSRTQQRWTLVRSAGSESEEPKAMSLISWHRLDGVARYHDHRTIGMAFLGCMRDAAGEGEGEGEESAESACVISLTATILGRLPPHWLSGGTGPR